MPLSIIAHVVCDRCVVATDGSSGSPVRFLHVSIGGTSGHPLVRAPTRPMVTMRGAYDRGLGLTVIRFGRVSGRRQKPERKSRRRAKPPVVDTMTDIRSASERNLSSTTHRRRAWTLPGRRYAAVGAPKQVASARARPGSVRSPTQATCPSGRINTAAGAVTSPRTGSSHTPT